MMGLLQSPTGMVLLLALTVGIYFIATKSERKRKAARWERAKRRPGTRLASADTANLRKKDPNAESKLGQAIADFSFSTALRRRFELAGMTITVQTYLMRCIGVGVGLSLVLMMIGMSSMVALFCGLVLGYGIPHLYVSRRIKKRKLAFLKLFPEAIELIVRGLRAGLPVSESFIVVSKEIPEPVANVFFTISQQTGFGVPMEKALSDAAEMLGLTEFNFFVTTIILQRETGGNLGEILSNLAQVLRDRQMMKLKITALSSEARASGYIVGALPFFVFGALTMLSPNYLLPLYEDPRGHTAVMIAAGMMVFGSFMMKRMTQFEI